MYAGQTHATRIICAESKLTPYLLQTIALRANICEAPKQGRLCWRTSPGCGVSWNKKRKKKKKKKKKRKKTKKKKKKRKRKKKKKKTKKKKTGYSFTVLISCKPPLNTQLQHLSET
jgi:hypothetical protein